ncbi:hypothetical protein HU200_043204 [Digitaria exilis]|uniref:Peptidase S8/S53 domain-containing protein n=1 Tax=Digitaria exilis TaxID=1010633 RepID=A0A835B5G8_9POAL|nr:hypothetical protein HU200_043204 [Digitaria exilis]
MSATALRTGAAILRALSTASAAHLHAHALKLGVLPSCLHLSSALLKSYAASGRVAAVRQLFDETPRRDVPLWNALVFAYARSGHPLHALVSAMAEGAQPNGVSVTSLLSACAQLRSSVHGRELHGYAVRNLVDLDLPVLLVNMYGKCGRLAYARMVFAGIGVGMRSAVSWTSMINACSENGRPTEALEVFEEMRSAGVKVDEVTLLAVISACTRLDCTLSLGDWVEQCVLAEHPCRHCPHTHAWEEREGDEMLREGFQPDEVIFLSVINACGHSSLVNEGRRLFKTMVEEYGITPWMEHYGSIVDVLCRSGALSEAFEFVLAMPVKPDPVIWLVLSPALARKCLSPEWNTKFRSAMAFGSAKRKRPVDDDDVEEVDPPEVTENATPEADKIIELRGSVLLHKIKAYNILAPGNLIWSAWAPNGTDESNYAGEGFAMVSGTSMAAPHIAGIVALIKQKNPKWSPSAMKNDDTFTGHTFDCGNGAVNPKAALDPGLVHDASKFISVCAIILLVIVFVVLYSHASRSAKLASPSSSDGRVAHFTNFA